MKLISLNQFVQEHYKEYETDSISAEQYANRVKNYEKFLSTPLSPGVFKGKNHLINGFVETKRPLSEWEPDFLAFQKIRDNKYMVNPYWIGPIEIDFNNKYYTIEFIRPLVTPLGEKYLTLTPNATKLFL